MWYAMPIRTFTLLALFLPSICCAAETYDARNDFEVSFYFGLAIDTFAASEKRLYLNPDSASGKQERAVGGIDFEYRLYGKPANPFQLWVYGDSMHGMRSAEIDCSANGNADFFLCRQGRLNYQTFRGRDPAADLLLMIRNASSLEGMTGLRFEFLTLNKNGSDPGNLYFKAQAGFLDVAGSPGGALAEHQLALGAIATNGFFQGSYIEGGWGRSDLFTTHRHGRKKMDAFLTWKFVGAIRAFAQVTVDTDLGPGSDSIQSYVGLDFDLRGVSFGK